MNSLLATRKAEIAEGKLPGYFLYLVAFDQLAEDFKADYEVNQKKSLNRAQELVDNLTVYFKGYRAGQIDTTAMRKYIEKRQTEKAKNGTINRELSALRRMFNLAIAAGKLNDKPFFPMLQERKVRTGFFEHEEFLALRKVLPDYLKGMVTFAHSTGWRLGEIQNLRWSQVDMAQGIITLNPGETKNDKGRNALSRR